MKKLIHIFVIIIFLLFFLPNLTISQIPKKYQILIDQGEFSKAQKLMRLELANKFEMNAEQRLDISFQIERLERIKKDFAKTKEEIIAYIKKYVPEVSDKDLNRWEQEKSLEFKIIDGKKCYFNNAAPNLFRINKKLKAIKKKKDTSTPAEIYNRLEDVRQIIKQAKLTGDKYVNPVHVKVTYTLTVNKDAVPDGKIIRCWLPFPRQIPNRQIDVKLISCLPERHIISPENYLQRTIYFEQSAKKGTEICFKIIFEFKNYAVYQKIDANKVTPAIITPALEPFVAERPPHIVFSDELKQLSEKIVGKETNPYFIARKIFKYVNDNIPWASAREYSTFANVSDYVYQNHHCDCGMHSIFFITLCRMNGIPTRWQSGWTTKPGGGGMHDWGEIYFEPYGWLPVDSDIGLVDSEKEEERWFFLGGMDAYRLIVNDGYSQSLYPAKIHFRSETIDFQRGEVEWEGGNLYFDQWDYDYEVKLLN